MWYNVYVLQRYGKFRISEETDMKEQKLVPMPGLDKLDDFAKRQRLIRELEKLHREQRAWQRMVNDEELNYEVIERLTTDELEKIVAELRK